MKKSMKIILSVVSYLFSYLLSYAIIAIIFAMIYGRTDNHINTPFGFTVSGLIAVPICLLVVFPSLKALHFRQIRRHKVSLSLAQSIRKYGKKLPATGAAVFFVKDDQALTVMNASEGFWRLIKRSKSDYFGKRNVSLAALIHENDVDMVRGIILGNELAVPQIDFRMVLDDSSIVWCRLCGVKEELSHSGVTITNCVMIDITDFMNTERDLSLEKERYRLLLSNLSSAIWEYDVERDQMYLLNRKSTEGKFKQVKNYRTSLINAGEVHPDHIDAYIELCNQLRTCPDNIETELRLRNFSGNYAWYSVTGTPLRDDSGRIISYIGQIKHISEPKDTERSSIIDYDPLTHLSNRYAFEGIVNNILSNSTGRGALFVLNVDRFKSINKNLGRLFGDALLIELSEALKSLFSVNSIFSRISGDEFAIYVDNYESDEKVFELAGALCGCVKHCFINTDKTESVTCCVGVALYPSHGTSFEQLFFLADSALIMAKHRGPGNYYVYNSGIEDQLSYLSKEHDAHLENAAASSESLSFKNDTLLSQVIDILFESRELSSSINLIISLLGRRFKLDRSYVIEFSGDMEHGTITYHWASELMNPLNRDHMVIPIDKVRSEIFCSSRDEYFLCNDMKAFAKEHPSVAALTQEYNVSAMLQCPILDGSELLGCFSFVVCRDGYQFAEEDVQEILMITKIIIGYLVRLRTKQDIDRITYLDKLTGSMNFNAFQLEFERLLNSSSGQNHAIVYSDIDRFKFINEKYGYRAGDAILRSVSDIYRSEIRGGEFFGRVTGDKFIALLSYGSCEELERRINTIHERINAIKKTDTISYHLPVRSGVYKIQHGETSVSGMIDRANLARKSVKNIHINAIAHFNENMKSRLSRQKDIEEVMADALAHEEFVVFYQPKFALSDNKLAGAEALVRWKRPNSSKLMRPDEFIPIFEDNGFVIELDFYVLEHVCRKLRHDMDHGMPVYPISVNFSRTHINTDNLIERLNACLKKYNIPPNLIEIEITESALTENEGYLADIIKELHGIGLIVSMDDFGSGFSSLNLLKNLPVDILKIDKNFFAGDSATARERCIIENVVNMARSLGIHVVSEGVETAEQATFLRSIKCDLAQGYLFGPPLDERSFDRTYLLA